MRVLHDGAHCVPELCTSMCKCGHVIEYRFAEVAIVNLATVALQTRFCLVQTVTHIASEMQIDR
jgi:hypothetical protein